MGLNLRNVAVEKLEKIILNFKIMNMIKEYLRRKQATSVDLDMLANRLENVINLDDINSLTIELLTQFDSLNIQTQNSHQV